MNPSEVQTYVKASPFRPFQIHMSSGATHEIRHPEMIKVGSNVVIVFSLVGDDEEIFDKWQSLSLSLIESISHLEAPAA